MRYFYDTEFHEFKKSSKLGRFKIGKVDTIDLISIGMISEEGHEFYAICNEFDVDAAWENEWLRNNVLVKIYKELANELLPNSLSFDWNKAELKSLLKGKGSSKEKIATELKSFIYTTSGIGNPETISNWDEVKNQFPIEFWGYYSDYDHVVLCWLFGRMIDLPKGFPWYTLDLKQMMLGNGLGYDFIKNHCPEPENEHNALADAIWNKKLYMTIETYMES